MTEVKNAVKEYLASIGRRGGSSGTGAKKRRSPEHYKRMAEIRKAKRKAKKPKQAKGKADE